MKIEVLKELSTKNCEKKVIITSNSEQDFLLVEYFECSNLVESSYFISKEHLDKLNSYKSISALLKFVVKNQVVELCPPAVTDTDIADTDVVVGDDVLGVDTPVFENVRYFSNRLKFFGDRYLSANIVEKENYIKVDVCREAVFSHYFVDLQYKDKILLINNVCELEAFLEELPCVFEDDFPYW